MDTDYRNSIARWYFYITPLFILLDYLWGISIRVVALDSVPQYKGFYYGFCVFCGVVMFIFPRYSFLPALFESTINFAMIAISLFMVYIHGILGIAETDVGLDAMYAKFNVYSITNLLLAGSCAVFTFKKGLLILSKRFGPSQWL